MVAESSRRQMVVCDTSNTGLLRARKIRKSVPAGCYQSGYRRGLESRRVHADTFSYGWSKMDRLEVTGAEGGPVHVQGDEGATLGVLALLAERRKAHDPSPQ